MGDAVEVGALVGGPVFFGEDFDFVESGEAGFFDHAADGADVDAAVAHEGAVREEVSGYDAPVADVEAGEITAFAEFFDFLFEVGVPPDVVDIDGNAYGGMVELFADVPRFGDAVDAGLVGGVHGVERFDGELDACGLSMIEAGGDAVGDLLSSHSKGRARFGPDDKDDHVGTDGGGFVEAGSVGVDRGLSLGGVGCDKEPTSDESGDLEAGAFDDASGFFDADGFDDVAPDGEPAEAGFGVVCAALGQ